MRDVENPIPGVKPKSRLGYGNPNFYQDASKRLFPLFLQSSYEEKASILKILASNYSLVKANT